MVQPMFSKIKERIPKSAYLMLPVMALAFYIAFIPHQDYPYPVHIDDWIHWAHSEAILEAGSLNYVKPFIGEGTISISSNLELGFQLFWGVFHSVSGISWLTIFRFFPGLILVFIVLAVYIMAHRHGFGWEAAFFTCLIPTTVGILGPAFIVPVAMGLLFIPLALFVVFNFRGFWTYVVLFIFSCFLVAIHAPSAICLVIVLLPYIVLNLKGSFLHSLGIFLALAIPFLVPFPWILDMLLPTAQKLLTPQVLPDYVDFPRIIRTYGYYPVGLCLLGTLVLAVKGGKQNYSLIFGLLLLLLMLVVFFTFHYGISIMYERGLMFMMLMVGIVAGAGLMAVKNLRLPESLNSIARVSKYTRYVGWSLCVILVGVTLFIAIPDRHELPYYHMIDDKEYEDFVWIRDNVDEGYDKAILDPWKVTPFTVITGIPGYSRIHTAPTEKDVQARIFLDGGCGNTTFLKENGISLVYCPGGCSNPDLVEIREGIFVLKK